MTAQPITSGQRKQGLRVVEDAYEKALENAGLDKNGMQNVLERGDELKAAVMEVLVRQFGELALVKTYEDEEVRSTYTYPSEYKGPKPIAEQVSILRELFPEFHSADEQIATGTLPKHAEGWFAIPRWQKLAPTYGEALEKVIAMIASKRRLYNYRQGQIAADYLRQHARTEGMLGQIAEQQGGHNIMVVAAQFGLRHRGKSVRRARVVFEKNEFGLGAFAVGIMLLTHPERLVRWEQLHIDCAGDEYSPEGDDDFSDAPIFYFNDGKVRFYAYRVSFPREFYGSASAFLTQE